MRTIKIWLYLSIRILVIDRGSIVERGNHQQLLAAKGKYYRLWSARQQARSWQLIRSPN